jgi:hypothetical protein
MSESSLVLIEAVRAVQSLQAAKDAALDAIEDTRGGEVSTLEDLARERPELSADLQLGFLLLSPPDEWARELRRRLDLASKILRTGTL